MLPTRTNMLCWDSLPKRQPISQMCIMYCSAVGKAQEKKERGRRTCRITAGFRCQGSGIGPLLTVLVQTSLHPPLARRYLILVLMHVSQNNDQV